MSQLQQVIELQEMTSHDELYSSPGPANQGRQMKPDTQHGHISPSDFLNTPNSGSTALLASQEASFSTASKRRAVEYRAQRHRRAQHARRTQSSAARRPSKATSSVCDTLPFLSRAVRYAIQQAEAEAEAQRQPQPPPPPPSLPRLTFQERYAQQAPLPPRIPFREWYIQWCERNPTMVHTYTPEPHVPRNQHVLGLKYMHDQCGQPRRLPTSQPTHIDVVSAVPAFGGVTLPPPPGLDTQRGQFRHEGMEIDETTVLCRYRHCRMVLERGEEDCRGRDMVVGESIAEAVVKENDEGYDPAMEVDAAKYKKDV